VASCFIFLVNPPGTQLNHKRWDCGSDELLDFKGNQIFYKVLHIKQSIGAEMKHCIETHFSGFATIALLVILSSCTMAPRSHLGDKAMADESIELQSTEENKIWSTEDLSIHYSLLDQGNFFDIKGFVEISTSVTYTFPLADYLYIYVYLLDGEGVATSRHSIRPFLSTYNPFPEKAAFSATLPKDRETAYLAFGYFGNFVSIEREEGGRMRGYEKLDWTIYHEPF
jgi:hypothetical protein